MSSHEIVIRDLRTDKGAQRRARELGIHRVPAVVVNGTVTRGAPAPIDVVEIRSLLR